MGSSEADAAIAKALAAEMTAHTHDQRIDAMYRQDVRIIYAFVVAMWVVLWGVFFFVVQYMEDPLLIAALVTLGVTACIFNSVGMIQNTRRLGQERVRFYSQDLYWQDRKKEAKRAARGDK
jgi:hypothetical protein